MSDSEILVRCEHVSKKFCKTLKRSLWYGVKDIASELNPFGEKSENGKLKAEMEMGTGVEGAESGKPKAEMGQDCSEGEICAADLPAFMQPPRDEDLRKDEFWAVRDISFELRRGECLGLIGRNGAGKSTLLKILNGIIKPDRGRVEMRGRIGALIELSAGFNPVLTGRENVYSKGAVLGLTKSEIDARYASIVEFAGIGGFLDTPLQNYSSGMRVRLGFAVSAEISPDVLIVDEVLAVGDVAFQRKCLQRMSRYVKNGGCVILVSHNMHAIQSICSRGILLSGDEDCISGAISDVVKAYYEVTNDTGGSGSCRSGVVTLTDAEPVTILGVEIRSKMGDEIRVGDTVMIRLRYRSLCDISNATWGFSIWTGDQVVRIATSTASWHDHTTPIHCGDGTLTAELPRITLMQGAYCLKAGIYDRETSWPYSRLGWEDPPVPFSVRGRGCEVDNRRQVGGDLVNLETTWQD